MEYPELTTFITTSLQSGTPPDSIRASLIGAGWDPMTVNVALASTIPQPKPAFKKRWAVMIVGGLVILLGIGGAVALAHNRSTKPLEVATRTTPPKATLKLALPTTPLVISEGGSLSFPIVQSRDLSNLKMTVSQAGNQPLPAGAKINYANGTFEWTPSCGQSGDYTFTFQVTSPNTNPASQNVKVQISPAAPSIRDFTLTTEEGTALPITIRTDRPSCTPLVYSIIQPPLHGTLDGSGPKLTYTPGTGSFDQDSFKFQASNAGVMARATVTITIHHPSLAPAPSPSIPQPTSIPDSTPPPATQANANIISISPTTISLSQSSVPVELKINNPTEVAGIQGRLLYDPTVLVPIDPGDGSENSGGVIKQSLGIVNYETNATPENGLKGLTFAVASGSGTSSSGAFLTLRFKAKAGASGETQLIWDPDSSKQVIAGISATVGGSFQPGKITIVP